MADALPSIASIEHLFWLQMRDDRGFAAVVKADAEDAHLPLGAPEDTE